MQTVGEFLEECGGRLAPFERLRVGRAGCVVALAAMAGALGALALGARDVHGSWASGFRFVVLCGLGSVIVAFIGYAMVETVVERSVRRRVRSFLSESGTDLETLQRAAEMRRGQLTGASRVLALLKDGLT